MRSEEGGREVERKTESKKEKTKKRKKEDRKKGEKQKETKKKERKKGSRNRKERKKERQKKERKKKERKKEGKKERKSGSYREQIERCSVRQSERVIYWSIIPAAECYQQTLGIFITVTVILVGLLGVEVAALQSDRCLVETFGQKASLLTFQYVSLRSQFPKYEV